MKVNYKNDNNISFNGFWGNNGVKKMLKFASNYSALFAATTTLTLSAGVRPLVIIATPSINKENKTIACAKSISSGCLEFLLTLALSLPLAAAIKKIDKNPNNYLTNNAIKNLSDGKKILKDSKAYSLATQIFKLGLGFAVILPKAILTSLGIPLVLNKIEKNENLNYKEQPTASKNINFNGKKDNLIAKEISKILNSNKFQKFVDKYKNSNFIMHIFALKDTFATLAFVYQAEKSPNIKDKQKPFLISNSLFSTGLSILSGYTIDKLTNKYSDKIIHKISIENKKDNNLPQYIEGFNIMKKVFILALIYYTLIPIISLLLAQHKKTSLNK